jgi:hypothetical protein
MRNQKKHLTAPVKLPVGQETRGELVEIFNVLRRC